jgi:hypothetical protein
VDQFSLLGFCHSVWELTQNTGDCTFSRHETSYTRTLALGLFCPHQRMMST